MSDPQYRLRLADGRIVTGPIQGCGGVIPSGQCHRVQVQIDRANAGEPLGIYEPAPGCASLNFYNPDGANRRETINLRGAVLLGEYDPENVDIFIGVYPTGIVYADRSRQEHGDYLTVARLPFRTLEIEKLEALAEITIEIAPEEVPIEGNASAIDEDTDRETTKWIRDQLDRGNDWAWCTVIVRAKYAGAEGVDALGCCSYESEEAFKVRGGYYEDMVRTALHDLAATLDAADGALAEVRL